MTTNVTQLALFDNLEDERPLPLIIAEKWKFPLACIEQANPLYCARDWYIGLGGNKSEWSRSKTDWLSSAQPVEIEVKRERRKPEMLEFVTDEGLYLIAARMRSKSSRPQLDAVKRYLAKAGVKLDADRRRAITDPLWLSARRKGVDDRKGLTGALSANVVRITPRHYGLATNALYDGLWQRSAAALKLEMGLGKNDNLRDHQPTQAFHYQGLVESSAAMIIEQIGAQSPEQAIETIARVAKTVGIQARELSDILGIDIATGKRLLQ